MMSKIKRWLTPRPTTFWGMLVIPVVAGIIVMEYSNIERWQIWDKLLDKEPSDIPVVLSPKLQFDAEGTLTARVRLALEKMGVDYRTIDREFPELPPVVPSGDLSPMIIEQGERLLEQHGGDVVVYGTAGITDGHVFLRLFVRSDCGCLHGATPFDLTDEGWEGTLKLMIELVMTTALGTKYRGGDWVNSGLPLQRSLRIWEKKFGRLAEMVGDETLKAEATDLADETKLLRMKAEGDGTGIQEVRRMVKDRLSAGLEKCKKDQKQCHIRRELLSLADLEIYDGLMNGLPERIEEGLSIALLAGRDAMAREAARHPEVLRPPMQAGLGDWLSMANLVLACDDQPAMEIFVDQIEVYLSSDKGPIGRRGDVERMVLPMTVLRHADAPREVLEEYYTSLSRHPYFGWSQPNYWRDPFVHAKRSIRRRLQRMDAGDVGQVDARFLGRPQCPSLSRWMENKGWTDVSGGRRVPSQESEQSSLE